MTEFPNPYRDLIETGKRRRKPVGPVLRTAGYLALAATPIAVTAGALGAATAAGEALHGPVMEAYWGDYDPQDAADDVGREVVETAVGTSGDLIIPLHDGRGQISIERVTDVKQVTSFIDVDMKARRVSFAESIDVPSADDTTLRGNLSIEYELPAADTVTHTVQVADLQAMTERNGVQVVDAALRGVRIYPDRTTDTLAYEIKHNGGLWDISSNGQTKPSDQILAKEGFKHVISEVAEANEAAAS